MIVSVKNWNLEKRNRTVNEDRLGAELEGARGLEVPLLSHVHNKKLKRNWFHLFDVDELEDPKETSPDWLRNEKDNLRVGFRPRYLICLPKPLKLGL